MIKTSETCAPQALVVDASKIATIGMLLDHTKLPPTYIPYGTVLGKITATGKGRLYTKAKVKTSGSSLTTVEVKPITGSIVVIPFVSGEAITIGTDEVTVTSVDHINNTISFTPAVTVVADEEIKLTTDDGSATAVGVMYSDIQNSGIDYWQNEDRNVAAIDWGLLYALGCVNLDATAKTTLSTYILFR